MLNRLPLLPLALLASPAFAIDCPSMPANGVYWSKKEFQCIMAREKEKADEERQKTNDLIEAERTGNWAAYQAKYYPNGVPAYDPFYETYLDVKNKAAAIQRQEQPSNYFFPPK